MLLWPCLDPTLTAVQYVMYLGLRRVFSQDALGNGRLRPGVATWQTRWNMISCFILSHWPHYVKTWRHPQNRKYMMVIYYRQRRTKPWLQKHAQKIWWKLDIAGFEVCKRTNRHTDTLIAILRLHTGGEVIMERMCQNQIRRVCFVEFAGGAAGA